MSSETLSAHLFMAAEYTHLMDYSSLPKYPARSGQQDTSEDEPEDSDHEFVIGFIVLLFVTLVFVMVVALYVLSNSDKMPRIPLPM